MGLLVVVVAVGRVGGGGEDGVEVDVVEDENYDGESRVGD